MVTARNWSGRPVATNSRDGNSAELHSRIPLILAATISTLGGLLFGYDNIVISGAIGFLSQRFHLDAAGIGWAADAPCWVAL